MTKKSMYGLAVKSISDHWSAGGRGSVSSSSFSNYKFQFRAYPGIEYDIFPYTESTRKQLRFLYTVGYTYYIYVDTTIYDQTKEGLFGHSLDIALELTQKWGSIDASLNHSLPLPEISIWICVKDTGNGSCC